MSGSNKPHHLLKHSYDEIMAGIKAREDEVAAQFKKERDEARLILRSAYIVCDHSDGEKFVNSYDYHRNEDESHWECVFCGEHLRDV